MLLVKRWLNQCIATHSIVSVFNQINQCSKFHSIFVNIHDEAFDQAVYQTNLISNFSPFSLQKRSLLEILLVFKIFEETTVEGMSSCSAL